MRARIINKYTYVTAAVGTKDCTHHTGTVQKGGAWAIHVLRFLISRNIHGREIECLNACESEFCLKCVCHTHNA